MRSQQQGNLHGESAGKQEGSSVRSPAVYAPMPGDLTFIVSNEDLHTVTFQLDDFGNYIVVHYADDTSPPWPSPDISRRGDVLVAIDGRSTLLRKSHSKILDYLNTLRNRRAYELTFRLPQVAAGLRGPVSARTIIHPNSLPLEGYMCKLSRGSILFKPKWSIRYFVLDTNTRMLRRYKARVSVADPDAMMSAESPRIPLDDVIKVTEAVQQPAPDAAAAPGVAFHTRFDLVMKDGSRRCFDTPTPEDARMWVSLFTRMSKQTVLTEEPLEPLEGAVGERLEAGSESSGSNTGPTHALAKPAPSPISRALPKLAPTPPVTPPPIPLAPPPAALATHPSPPQSGTPSPALQATSSPIKPDTPSTVSQRAAHAPIEPLAPLSPSKRVSATPSECSALTRASRAMEPVGPSPVPSVMSDSHLEQLYGLTLAEEEKVVVIRHRESTPTPPSSRSSPASVLIPATIAQGADGEGDAASVASEQSASASEEEEMRAVAVTVPLSLTGAADRDDNPAAVMVKRKGVKKAKEGKEEGKKAKGEGKTKKAVSGEKEGKKTKKTAGEEGKKAKKVATGEAKAPKKVKAK